MGKSKLPQLRGSSGERETKDEEKKSQHPKEREGMREKWLRWTGRSSKKQGTPTRDVGGGGGRAKSAPPVAADSNSSSFGGADDAIDEMQTGDQVVPVAAGDKFLMDGSEQQGVRNGDGFYSDFIPINMVNYQIPHHHDNVSLSPRDDVKSTGSGNGSSDAVSNYSSGGIRVRSTPPSTLTPAAVKGPMKTPPSWPLPVPKVMEETETETISEDVAEMLARHHHQLYSHLRERSLSPTATSPNTAVYAEISEIMAYKRQLGDATLPPGDLIEHHQQYPQYIAHQHLFLQQQQQQVGDAVQFQQMQQEMLMEDADMYHQQQQQQQQLRYREHYDLQMQQQYNAQDFSQQHAYQQQQQQQVVSGDHNALYISTGGAAVGDGYAINRDASLKRASATSGSIYSPRVVSTGSEDSAVFADNRRRERPTSAVAMGNASPTLGSRPSCGVTMARLRATRHIYSDVESTYGYGPVVAMRQSPSTVSAQQTVTAGSDDVSTGCYDAGSQCDDADISKLHATNSDVTYVTNRHSLAGNSAIYHSEPVCLPKANVAEVQVEVRPPSLASSSAVSVKRTSGTQTASSMSHIYRAMASQTQHDATGRPPKSSMAALPPSSTRRYLPSVSEDATLETAKLARATRSSPLQLQGYAAGQFTKVKAKVREGHDGGSDSTDSEHSGLNESSLDSSDGAADCRRQKTSCARGSSNSRHQHHKHQGQGHASKDKSRSKARHSAAGKHRKHHHHHPSSNIPPAVLAAGGARSASLTDSDEEEREQASIRHQHQHHRLSLGHVRLTPDSAAAAAAAAAAAGKTNIKSRVGASCATSEINASPASSAAHGSGQHHYVVPASKEIDSEESISDAYAREDANRRLLHMTNTIYAPALVKPYSSSIRAVHFTGTTHSTAAGGSHASSNLAPRCDLIPVGSDLIIELMSEEGYSDVMTPVDFDPERNILNQPLAGATFIATSSVEDPGTCPRSEVVASSTTAISTCTQQQSEAAVELSPAKMQMQSASLALNRSLTNPDVTMLPPNLQGDSRSCSVGVDTTVGCAKQQDLTAGSRLSESGYDSWKSQDSSSTVCTVDDGRNCLSMRRRDFRSGKSPDSYQQQQQQQQHQFLSVDRRNRYHQTRPGGSNRYSKGASATCDSVEDSAASKSISPVSPVTVALVSAEYANDAQQQQLPHHDLDLDDVASKLLVEMEKYTSSCDIMPKTSTSLTFSTQIAQALEDANEKQDSGDSVRSSYENKQTFKEAVEMCENNTATTVQQETATTATGQQQNGGAATQHHAVLQKSASNDEDVQWRAIRPTSSLSTLNCVEEPKVLAHKNAAELLTAGSRASLYEHLCEDQLERMSLFNGSCDSFHMNSSDMESSIDVSEEADPSSNQWNVDDVVVPDVTPTVELVPILTPTNQSTPVKTRDGSATNQQQQPAAAAKRPTTVLMSPRTGSRSMVSASSSAIKDNDKTPVAEPPETTNLPYQQQLQQVQPSPRPAGSSPAHSVPVSTKSAHHQTSISVAGKPSHFGFGGKNVAAVVPAQEVTENVSPQVSHSASTAAAQPRQPSVENVSKATRQAATKQSSLLLPDRMRPSAAPGASLANSFQVTPNSQRRKLPTEPPPSPGVSTNSSPGEMQQQPKMQHRSASPRVAAPTGSHPSSKIASPSPTTKPKSAGGAAASAKQQSASASQQQQILRDGKKSGSRQDLRSNSGSRQDLRSGSVDETSLANKQVVATGSRLAQAAKRSSLVGPSPSGGASAEVMVAKEGTLISSAERQQSIKSPMPMPQLKKALHAPPPSNIPFAGRSASLSPSFAQSPPQSPLKRAPPAPAVTSSPVHGRSSNSRIPAASRDGSATNRHASNTTTPPPPSPTPSTSNIAQTRSSTTNNALPLKPSGLRKTFAPSSSSRKNSAS